MAEGHTFGGRLDPPQAGIADSKIRGTPPSPTSQDSELPHSGDPRSSSLRLTPDGNFTDGKLLARNLAGWNLSDCRLVLLTGCETAMAGGLGSDDLAGFPRAVFEAGCQGILGSLWPVEDEVTRQMTLHLIDSARARISPAEALREACRSIRDKSTTDRVSGWGLTSPALID